MFLFDNKPDGERGLADLTQSRNRVFISILISSTCRTKAFFGDDWDFKTSSFHHAFYVVSARFTILQHLGARCAYK